MALWEYKVITSGLHGFASPALLEAHLNSLAKDEWEIVIFQTQPNNPLAFNGLARRATVRDWSPPPEQAVAPAAVAHAPAVKAYEPPTKAVAAGPARAEEPASAATEEKVDANAPSRESTLRTFRDTDRDTDPDAEDDDWDNWDESADALPTFFEALKPHLRRNQKGVGMSVAVDYLAKRWDQREADLVGALKECGFTIPDTEEIDPDYFEFEGDLYWVNRNNRGLLFINTREKPRPVFRTALAKKLDPNDPAAAELVAERASEKADIEKRKTEREDRAARQAAAQAAAAAAKEAKLANQATHASQANHADQANEGPAISDQDGGEAVAKNDEAPAGPLPTGQELLDRIRPLMRRNRRGPGYSGSVSFLARALKHADADLAAGLAVLGLTTPANANDKPVYVEIGDGVYWMNKDNRGGIWINGREKREGGKHGENAGGENAAPASNGNENQGSQTNGSGPSETAESGASSLPPTDVNVAANAAANSASGAAAVTLETDAKPEKSSDVSSAELSASPSDAQVEGIPPEREVVPQPAQPGTVDRSTDAENSHEASDAASGTTSNETATSTGDEEGGAKPKSARPRRPSTRPRTRKAKVDTDGSSSTPATPETDGPSDEGS